MKKVLIVFAVLVFIGLFQFAVKDTTSKMNVVDEQVEKVSENIEVRLNEDEHSFMVDILKIDDESQLDNGEYVYLLTEESQNELIANIKSKCEEINNEIVNGLYYVNKIDLGTGFIIRVYFDVENEDNFNEFSLKYLKSLSYEGTLLRKFNGKKAEGFVYYEVDDKQVRYYKYEDVLSISK